MPVLKGSSSDSLSKSGEAESSLDEKGRFASLREEISKARKKKTGVNFEPSDLLRYRFVDERDDGIKQRATVVEIDNENNLFTLEYITGDRDLLTTTSLSILLMHRKMMGTASGVLRA